MKYRDIAEMVLVAAPILQKFSSTGSKYKRVQESMQRIYRLLADTTKLQKNRLESPAMELDTMIILAYVHSECLSS